MENSCCFCEYHYWVLKKKMPGLLRTAVMQRFIEVEENKKAFDEAMKEYNADKLRALDERFKAFYHLDRAVGYMIGVVKRYSIDYDKRVNLRNKRFPLVLDGPPTSVRGDGFLAIKDLIDDGQSQPDILFERKENKKELGVPIRDNHRLSRVLRRLNSRQKKILNLYYVQGYTNKEIGEFFNQTEQNVSYWHKKIKKQIQQAHCNQAKRR